MKPVGQRSIDFQVVWARIAACEGEEFQQARGGRFKYVIDGEALVPDRTNWRIPKAHFKDAFAAVPLRNTVVVRHLFGPSYIYAVLMDERIRQENW